MIGKSLGEGRDGRRQKDKAYKIRRWLSKDISGGIT